MADDALPTPPGPPPAFVPPNTDIPSPVMDDPDLFALVHREATANGLDPDMVYRVVKQESAGNPMAIGPVTRNGQQAQGLMQLMPDTAASFGVTNAFDPQQNVRAGVRYLARLHKQSGGDWRKTLSSYNAGPGASAKYGGVAPYPETQGYISKIMAGGPQGLAGTPPPQAPSASQASSSAPMDLTSLKPPDDAGQAPASSQAPPAQTPMDPDAFAAQWNAKQADPNAGLGNPAAEAASKATRLTPPPPWYVDEYRRTKQDLDEGLQNSGMDPRTPEGRRALAATAAAVGTGVMTDGIAPLLGAVISTGAGAVGGGLEASAEPGATDQSVQDAVRTSAGQEALGQAGGYLYSAVGSRMVARDVGERAAAALEAEKQSVLQGLRGKLQAAVDAFRATKQSANDALRTTTRAAKAATQAAQTSADRSVEAAKFHAGRAVQAAEGQVPGAVAARPEAAASQAAFDQMAGQPPPSASQVGTDIKAVVRGPIQVAKDKLGEDVENAAIKGPDLDLTKAPVEAGKTPGPKDVSVKGAAQDLVDRVLHPPAEEFPHVVPKEDASGAAQAEIDALPHPEQRAAAQAQMAAAEPVDPEVIIKHPIMKVIDRIANAKDKVSFFAAHQFKTQLDDALKNTFDQDVRRQLDAMTLHLRNTLRKTMAVHEPYNEATAAYARVAQLRSEGFMDGFSKLVRTDPEGFVHKQVNLKEPTHLAMMKDLLTTVPNDPAGQVAGQNAWRRLQDAITYYKILPGGIDQVVKRLDPASGMMDPEFAKLVLDTPQGRALQGVVDAYKKALTMGAQDEVATAAATQTAKAGVESAKQAGAQLVKQTEKLGAQGVAEQAAESQAAIDAQRVKGRQQVQYARGKVYGAPHSGNVGEDLPEGMRTEGAVENIVNARRTTPEEQKLADSSVGPKRTAPPEQTVANIIRAAALGPTNIWGGLSMMKLMRGPNGRELIHWALRSKANNMLLIHSLTSRVPGSVLAGIVRSAGLVGGHSASTNPKDIFDALSGTGKAGTPPPSLKPDLDQALNPNGKISVAGLGNTPPPQAP